MIWELCSHRKPVISRVKPSSDAPGTLRNMDAYGRGEDRSTGSGAGGKSRTLRLKQQAPSMRHSERPGTGREGTGPRQHPKQSQSPAAAS
jgi:hypothetical protein